jgi:DNA polymerase-3 subunit gamma/tau
MTHREPRMGYLAIARQWRPSRFDDLVGQEHVVQTIKNAIRMNRVSHAYLFSGARGVGKTSVARIFAKTLRCPNSNPEDATPCNVCPECVAISESRSVDVVEIDGASNNGVEAVRGIRENVAYGAASGTYKIYIIDEVHMLSLSAFNALLKTLEEPPAHVIFVFATTEVQKIPLTILSRCQRFEFRRLTSSQIVSRLQHILGSEKLALSEEALRAMAAHSDGSLRDALSLLDQVLSYFGDRARQEGAPLDEKSVVEALGISDSHTTRQLFAAILGQDTAGIIKLIGETYLSGVDLKHFAERCLEELRMLYLVALAHASRETLSADSLDISAGHFTELTELVKGAPVIQLERMAQILGKTIQQLGWSSNPRFVFEMAAVRMSKLGELNRIEDAVSGRHSGPSSDANEPSAPQPVAPTPRLLTQEPPPISDEDEMMMATSAFERTTPVLAPKVDGPQAAWKAFVDSVIKKRPLLGALLSHANFNMDADEKGKLVHLAFPAGSFYERQAGETRNRAEIEDLVKSYFGDTTRVDLSNNLQQTSISLEESKRLEIEAAKKVALEHPAVLKVQEVLGAEVVDINVET